MLFGMKIQLQLHTELYVENPGNEYVWNPVSVLTYLSKNE